MMNESNTSNHSTDVPYIVYESATARNERTVKRLVLALIISVILMFVSNALWLWAWQSYDYVSEDSQVTYQQDGQGVNIIGNRNGAGVGGAVDDYTQTETNPD